MARRSGSLQGSRAALPLRYAASVLKLAMACLAGFAIFLALTRIGLLSGIETVFYRGVVLAGISAIILFALLLVLNRKRPLVSEDLVVAAVAITFALSTAFVIVGPVTVDRSITVFLLAHMDRNSDESFTPARLQAEFEGTYLGEWDQIARRMEEQSITGYVVETEPGEYAITPQGRRAMRVFRIVADLFDTDPRFVGAAPGNGEDASAE